MYEYVVVPYYYYVYIPDHTLVLDVGLKKMQAIFSPYFSPRA